MEIKTKVCPKCGVEKELTEEFWHKRKISKSGFCISRCRGCFLEYFRERQRTNEAYREWRRKYHRANETCREQHRKYLRKSIKNLMDTYVKERLCDCGFLPDQITPELIELKRQQILAKRLLKQLKQWRETNESDNADVQGQQRTNEAVNERQECAQS
jgi:hypothetical protein